MEELINEIIALEWAFFDKVQNEGGRAPCQDDFRTFEIMRGSQYEAWNEATLESWRADLTAAKAEGRNPLAEKYGYMMCIDEPEEHSALASQLPHVSEEKKNLAHAITARLAPQNAAFAGHYPLVASHARPLSGAGDGCTSIETYQTGELWTYSERTLRLLDARIAELEAGGVNYAELVVGNSLKRRGFRSIGDAEDFLRRRAARGCALVNKNWTLDFSNPVQ